MSEIKKSVEGLLFYEDFSDPNSLMWTLSPSYMPEVLEFGAKGPVVTEKGLRIKHSEKYITYTIDEPRDEYACIVDLHHVPINFDDIGGVIVMATNNHYAECQTYLATSSSEIGNSEYFYQDIKELIDATLDNKYVTYKFDDEDDPDARHDQEQEEQEHAEDPTTNPYSPGDFKDTVYRYIKFYKVKYKYFFYASADGYKWIEVGNVSFETSSVIGLFLYAADGDYKEDLLRDGFFKCNSFAIYQSRYINIHGIDTLKEFELISDNKVLLRTDQTSFLHMCSRSNKTTLINTTELPMPIKDVTMRVYNRDDYTETYATYRLGDIYGGDEYIVTTDVRCFIGNDELQTNELYDLGKFYHGSNYIEMRVHNFDSEPADNLTLQVTKYSIYYGGDEEVKIALYEDHLPMHSLSFYKQIKIDRIMPGEGVTVYIKLTERPVQDFFMVANDYRFKIIME